MKEWKRCDAIWCDQDVIARRFFSKINRLLQLSGDARKESGFFENGRKERPRSRPIARTLPTDCFCAFCCCHCFML